MRYRGSTADAEETEPLSTKAGAGTDIAGRFCAVTLNIGGRNTNPMEFMLEGDDSEIGTASVAFRGQLFDAMRSDTAGPGALGAKERSAVEALLAELANGAERFASLLEQPTWARVYDAVRREKPELFNALNLATLQLGRPSPLEAPEACSEYRDALDYISGWGAWYRKIDRAGKFWTDDAPKKAAKHKLAVGTAFCGIFIFDLLCMQATKACFGPSPFRRVAEFAKKLPFATYDGKHAAATQYFRDTGASIICVQEGRALCDFPTIVNRYQRFSAAGDEYTMMLVPRGIEAESFSTPVLPALEAALSAEASAETAKAWRTTSTRVAVVRVTLDGRKVTAASVHCNKHESTADLLVALKAILEREAPADFFVIGCDTNVPGERARWFQERMVAAGLEIGCPDDQVTVAKQRTIFQTQTLKCGEVDVSCKDYMLSWGARFARSHTSYTPDLHTDFGVERGTERTVRLPTSTWPFDHSGVAVSFETKRARLPVSQPVLLSVTAVFVLALAIFAGNFRHT